MYANINTILKNDVLYTKYDVNFFPKKVISYLSNNILPPSYVDFYPEMSEIKKISIQILEDVSFNIDSNFSSHTGNSEFPGKASYVKIKTTDQIFIIGLHLFPWARLNKKETPSTINFYIKNNIDEKKNVELPEQMLGYFLKYLNQGKPNEKFTCIEFMNWMNGVYTDNLDDPSSLLDPYAFSLYYNIENLTIGDSIIFIKENVFIHAAIYIGKSLYIYHLGKCGVRVGSLENILEIYPSDKIEKLILKKQIISQNYEGKSQYYDSSQLLKFYSYYLQKGVIVPKKIDFYPEIDNTISKIDLRIYTERFFYFLGYRVQFSNIKIETIDKKKFVIALHLFPALRLRKKIETKINLWLIDNKANKTLLDFSENISKRLLKLINNGKPHSAFSNFEFVNYLKNKYTIKEPSNTKYFHSSGIEKFSICSIKKLKSGNSVALFKKIYGPPIHKAIYLGHEFFIWHMGYKGICISSFEGMFNYYPNAIEMAKIIVLSKN